MAKQTFKTNLNFQEVEEGTADDKVLVRTADGDVKEVEQSSIGGSVRLEIEEYKNNFEAKNDGLVNGDIFSLPFDYSKNSYLNAVVKPISVSRSLIVVRSAVTSSEFPIYLNIYNTAGTNSGNNIYLNGAVRPDWGDIRFFDNSGTSLPFGILDKQSSFITIAFKASIVFGENNFFLEYNKPAVAGDILKIGSTTDQHYDSGSTYVGRNLALSRLDNFSARMSSYLPDIILEGGDKYGEVTTASATLIGFMSAVTAKHNALATSLGIPNYIWGWGNHDFEYTSFANVQAQYNGLIGQVSGKLYAAWEYGDYQYISLDANYKPSDDTHNSLYHVGYGYVDKVQLLWLKSVLESATKPCIILCHQSLAEFDSARMQTALVTADVYLVTNRSLVRSMLEDSGKVILVIQGHMHTYMHNEIKGIPYISLVDLNEPAPSTYFQDIPYASLEGRWSILEIDKGTKTVKMIQERRISGVVQEIYNISIPLGRTVFDNEFGANLAATYSQGFLAEYGKSQFIVDPTDLYVNNRDYVTVTHPTLYLSEPKKSDKTFKLIGITGNPNWGRSTFNFLNQTGYFETNFSARIASGSEFYLNLKAGGLIGVYLGFSSAGNIDILNGSTSISVMTYSLNTWYDFKIKVDVVSKKYDVIVNGVLVAHQFSFYQAALSLNSVEWRTGIGVFYLDNFRIEKSARIYPAIKSVENC